MHCFRLVGILFYSLVQRINAYGIFSDVSNFSPIGFILFWTLTMNSFSSQFPQHNVLQCSMIGLPRWLSGKESTCQCRGCVFDPWLGKTPWSRKWQPTPVFLTGKFHGQRNLVGCSPWGHEKVSRDLVQPNSILAN